MGVAGLVFEPPPPNFEKMHNFPRYTNDIIMKYGYFHWFKSLKKSLGVSFTDILGLLDLFHFSYFQQRGSFYCKHGKIMFELGRTSADSW